MSANFAAQLQKILNDYEKDVTKNVGELSQKFAKRGAKELKGAWSGGGSGKYASGWTSQTESGRLSTTSTIYNKTAGLPHLLEHGHANRGGGRTAGRVHIAPVEQTLIEEFTKAVEGAIK